MQSTAIAYARAIYAAATPVIRIDDVGGRLWRRNVAKGSRIGPWLQGRYEILDECAWREQTPCLYLVSGADSVIRYVGISRNGLKHRWRTSPAYDAETGSRLPNNQLFHSQCWKHIERESRAAGKVHFEIRCITAGQLLPVLESLGTPLSAFAALRDDAGSLVASLERWFCNHGGAGLVTWNVAMTRR